MLPIKENHTYKIFIALFLFLFISVLFPYLPGHESDKSLWAMWTWHIRNYGLSNAYHSGTDYLPLYQWFMWLFGKFFDHPDDVTARIEYLRCFTLLFDFLGLWFAYKWMDKKIDFITLLVFSMLNLAYCYNTVIWGQVDGIMTTMIFISLYYAHKQKLIVSSVWILLAINMKLQAIIFLPIWGLLFLFAVIHKKNWKLIVYSLIAMAVVEILILFPFIKDKNGLSMVWNVVTGSVDKYPRVSMNAYNFWHLILPQNPWDVTDEKNILGLLNYKRAGMILFFTSSLLVLWPLIKTVLKKIKDPQVAIDKTQLWLICSLISISFFYFNTQMHERYCHPAFLFITAYCFYTRRFIAYILFSIAYFLNLEAVLQFLKLENYKTVIVHPKFVAGLFTLLIAYLAMHLFKSRKLIFEK